MQKISIAFFFITLFYFLQLDLSALILLSFPLTVNWIYLLNRFFFSKLSISLLSLDVNLQISQ